MTDTAWFWPAAALIGWTVVVWFALYVQRIGEMRASRIDAQRLYNRRARVELLQKTSAADNFNNLLELPMLFYVAMGFATMFDVQDRWLLILAWSFVGLRVVHSLIHITYNRVMHRFAVYALGAVTLFASWALLVVRVAQA
jgi:hypothetical protein